MLNSKALTKIQSIILIAAIVVAVVGAGVGYVLFSWEEESSETIKIGVLADLYGLAGKHVWQGTVLAAEELNAEGGILGRQVEVIGEDRADGRDGLFVSSALNRLIGYDKVDFIIIQLPPGDVGFSCQDIMAEHKKVALAISGNSVGFTQRVLDDYEKYKYFFSTQFNATSMFQGMTDSLLLCREITGFNKVGYLGGDAGWTRGVMPGLDNSLPENGFDLVYQGKFPGGTFDFTSYLAAAEAAETEILLTLIAGDEGIPFAKDYYDRQSPMVVYGGVLGDVATLQGWEMTDEKCNHVAVAALPIAAHYPLTSKTLPAKNAYLDRWGEEMHSAGARGYDALRFILTDAVERAGTIETEAVINALEETSIETSSARNFVFTESHGVMMGENPNNPDADYMLVLVFQWQNGEMVPVYPKKIMEEAGASLTYPSWPGPWD